MTSSLTEEQELTTDTAMQEMAMQDIAKLLELKVLL